MIVEAENSQDLLCASWRLRRTGDVAQSLKAWEPGRPVVQSQSGLKTVR